MTVVAQINVVVEDLDLPSLAWALSLERALLGEQWKRKECTLSGTVDVATMLPLPGGSRRIVQ